jgi:hypothetical protein
MKRRWTISGIVIAGLVFAALSGKQMTYVDSSGCWFQQKTVILGLEIPTRRWPVPTIGGPEPSPRLPWVEYAGRPLFLMRGTQHYKAGEEIYHARREAELERAE